MTGSRGDGHRALRVVNGFWLTEAWAVYRKTLAVAPATTQSPQARFEPPPSAPAVSVPYIGMAGSIWRNPTFLRVFSAATVSIFGSLVTRTALPFAAILVLGAGPGEVAAIRAFEIVGGVASAWSRGHGSIASIGGRS